MRTLLVIISVLSALVLAVPATAQTPEIELLDPCDNPDGLTVVSPAKRFTGEVETPIGQAFIGTTGDAGSYIIDLAGLPVGTTAKVDMTLDAEAVAIADYDLVVNGTGSDIAGTPETVSLTGVAHCAEYVLGTTVFFGTPLDALTLDIRVRS